MESVFEEVGKSGVNDDGGWFSSSSFEKGVEIAMQLGEPYSTLASVVDNVVKITSKITDAQDVKEKVTAIISAVTDVAGDDTGIIKANFPARIAFRVTSKIDSRTILDNSGADQLIGRGDMLYTQGNDLIRLQCAFVDTPEVADITDYIGSQKAYPDAYLLPEYIGEDGAGTTIENNVSERDQLFKDAAEVLVIAQQGSTSLLQRKLKLGYNRAGRIIDQLEASGIVGQFEGSKARQVLVADEMALNFLLDNEAN